MPNFVSFVVFGKSTAGATVSSELNLTFLRLKDTRCGTSLKSGSGMLRAQLKDNVRNDGTFSNIADCNSSLPQVK